MSELQTQFHVSGMKCDACIKSATEAVAKVSGVEQATFDLSSASATIVGNCDPQAVCLALTEAGYPAVVKSG